jgi:hypothetical protein
MNGHSQEQGQRVHHLVNLSVGCRNSAVVWLEDDEDKQYQNGERIFSIPNNAAKVRLA